MKLPGGLQRIVARVSDQLLWSFALFGFNFGASLLFAASGFAALAVATALAFIVIAMVRAWTANARIIAGAKVGLAPEQSLDIRSSLIVSVVGAAATAAITAVWIFQTESLTNTLAFSILAGFLVLADTPRQLLIYSKKYKSSIWISAVYALTSAISLLVAHLFSSAEMLIWIWYTGTLAALLLGLVLQRRGVARPTRKLRVGAYAWRLGAEALYAGVASQLAILLLYWIEPPSTTAGYRLAYSLVFAPAFMVIQGLSPLYTARLANTYLVRSEKLGTSGALWSSAITVLVVVCGLAAGLATILFPDYSNLVAALPYILPVGLSLLGAQLVEAAFQAVRFTRPPTFTHRLRIVVIGADLAIQVVTLVFAGVDGLVVGIAAVGIVKIAAAVVFQVRVARR